MLASFVIEPHYSNAINKNDLDHEAIRRIKEN